ncbi:hypothetical protein NDW01_26195 [Actinoallomurus sp. WRP6H-15]|nr:hypothetical protein [Actinoallomurus soli]
MPTGAEGGAQTSRLLVRILSAPSEEVRAWAGLAQDALRERYLAAFARILPGLSPQELRFRMRGIVAVTAVDRAEVYQQPATACAAPATGEAARRWAVTFLTAAMGAPPPRRAGQTTAWTAERRRARRPRPDPRHRTGSYRCHGRIRSRPVGTSYSSHDPLVHLAGRCSAAMNARPGPATRRESPAARVRTWSGCPGRSRVGTPLPPRHHGAYHFARPEDSSAASQAARFLSVVNPVPGESLWLDLEAGDLDQATTNGWAKAIRRPGHLRALPAHRSMTKPPPALGTARRTGTACWFRR